MKIWNILKLFKITSLQPQKQLKNVKNYNIPNSKIHKFQNIQTEIQSSKFKLSHKFPKFTISKGKIQGFMFVPRDAHASTN